MAHRKSLDPFESRIKTKAAIDRYQKNMLRTELGTTADYDDNAREFAEIMIPNDAQKPSNYNNEFEISPANSSNMHNVDNVDIYNEPNTTNVKPKPLLKDEIHYVCATSNNTGQETLTPDVQTGEDTVTRDVELIDNNDINLKSINNIFDVKNTSDLGGFIAPDVMLNSFLDCCKGEAEISSDVPEPVTRNLQTVLSAETQESANHHQDIIIFESKSTSSLVTSQDVMSSFAMNDNKTDDLHFMSTVEKPILNYSLAASKSDQDIEIIASSSNSHCDSKMSPKTNTIKNTDGKITILEEFEIVLDPETGIFCKKKINTLKDCESLYFNNTENLQIIESSTETVEEDNIKYVQPIELVEENVSQRKRKTKATNKSFRKSCKDFLDESDNEDFSAGSSEKWSAQESEEESSSSYCLENNKRRKKKKMMKCDEKQQNVSLKKIKKGNIAKIRKTRKDTGESYETIKGKKVEAKSMKVNPCLDGKCNRACKQISEERRAGLFKYYWDLSVQRRKDWLVRCAQKVAIKRKKTRNDISRRNVTYQYYINDGDGYSQVCQSFLLNTLDITQRHLLYTISNEEENMAQLDKRHPNAPIKYNDEVVNYAKQYIESLPAVPSHYCRQNTTKVYLPQELKNISNLYRLYLKKVEEDSNPHKLSEKMFSNLFREEYNISFHTPKKDKCLLCTKFQNQKEESNEEDREKMNEHLEEKRACYARFKLHQNLLDPETLTTSFDMQKVLNTPHGESMLLYYSRKYAMFNLTFYESGTRDVACYLWGESEGKRGSQEISSCLYLYLKDVDKRGIKHLLLYCDSCCGQNRNKVVMAALNNFLKSSIHLQVIQINFLLPGHTYMPVDSVHAVIENEVKRLIVWSPSQWPTFIEAARKRPKPYQIHLMEHTDFLDFEELTSKAFSPQLAKAVKFQKVRIVTFKKKLPDLMSVKYSMKEESEVHKFQLHQTPLKSTRGTKGKGKGKGKGKRGSKDILHESSSGHNQYEVIELKALYKERLPISITKYKDLKRLCENGTIPKRFHGEYLNLPFTPEIEDTLNDTDEDDERE